MNMQTQVRPMETTPAVKVAVRLSENQKKVIADKYLRDDPSAEVWLERVALNVALAELMFSPNMDRWNLFEGVSCRLAEVPTRPGQTTRLALFHSGIASSV